MHGGEAPEPPHMVASSRRLLGLHPGPYNGFVADDQNIHFGVCPSSSEPVCSRSYQHGRGVRDDLVMWNGRRYFPGGGGPHSIPRDEGLQQKCRNVFQASAATSGFCPQCGQPLVFTSRVLELGACSRCRRSYHQGDFANSFCPGCGTPVSIEPEVKTEYRRQNEIAILLAAVPSLQEAGYLPAGLSRKG